MWSVIIPAAASLIGGAMSSDAAGDAADQQAQSSAASIAEQRRQYDLTRTDTAPWRKAGGAAVDRLSVLMGLGGGAEIPEGDFAEGKRLVREFLPDGTDHWRDTVTGKFYETSPTGREQARADAQIYADEQAQLDPAYGSLTKKFTAADLTADPVYQSGLQFGLDEGTKGINARAIGSGMYDSGATLRALTQFGSDYGSTKANESYNRFNTDQGNVYNRLAGVSGTGQNAVNQVASAGTNMANAISGDITGAGNARAAGIVGGANAWGSAAQNINSAYANYNSNKTLQALLAERNNWGITPMNDGQGW